jgi:Family of unknown function (DUF5677)
MKGAAKLPVITFDGDKGFLSPQLRKWTTSTKGDYQKWFRFINRLNRAAMKVLAAIEPDPNKKQELCAALLCRRALQTFQGSILLAERGMIADALTLVRSCAETAIALGCFAADDKFLDRLIEDDANHRLTYGNVMLGDKYLSAPLTRKEISNIQKVVSAIKKKYPTSRPKSINWADAAKDFRMAVLYDMIYRTTSGGATHVTINALGRHAIATTGGPRLPYPTALGGKSVRQALTLTFQPETSDLVQCLSGAVSAILHAMNALNSIFPQYGIERTMKPHVASWAKLVG